MTPRDVDPGTPDDAHDELDHRDLGVASIDLLAGDADEGSARRELERPAESIRGATGTAPCAPAPLASEPPWPATDNPMIGFLIERCTEIATGDGLDAAAQWLAANAWIEGAIAERGRIERRISEG